MAENKTCDVCLGTMATGQGWQPIFTADCNHSFHFGCISNAQSQHQFCPVCNAKWSNLPMTIPVSSSSPSYMYQSPFNSNSPMVFPTFPMPQFPRPRLPYRTPTEPLEFCDDEPLLDPMSCDTAVGLQKMIIKAIPERPAVAASEFVSQFAVLVGLKAPSMSDDARQLQRAPIDLVTVLDVSGSMTGQKLDLVKQAVHFVIDNLGPSDRLSVVSFENQARRVLGLRRMTENGREDAKRSVNSLHASGGTNIVDGLKKGSRVLEERRHKNPVTSIIFLSDGNDTCNSSWNFSYSGPRQPPEYLHLLPPSIRPRNKAIGDAVPEQIFPVHSFGFGSDHDALAMHAISDASGGTFSFIESYEMVQDAFASCIGGLLSVVAQEIRLSVRSASHGVEIKSISSGRYASGISNQGSQGLINVGDLYADEEKEFLICLSIPVIRHSNREDEENERKTSLLDVMCSYKDVLSKETVKVECDLVEIRRPKSLTPADIIINLEVDRQRNRLRVAESIAQAQQMAEAGNLAGAQALLSKGRSDLLASVAGQAGDGLCMWLEADMEETERRMSSRQLYEKEGRAYALSGMSAHVSQRATTRGKKVAGAPAGESFAFGAASPQSTAPATAFFGAYATPQMGKMVTKSQQLNKTGGGNK